VFTALLSFLLPGAGEGPGGVGVGSVKPVLTMLLVVLPVGVAGPPIGDGGGCGGGSAGFTSLLPRFPSGVAGTSDGGGVAGISPSTPGVSRGTFRFPESSMVLPDTTPMFSATPDVMRSASRCERTSPLRLALFNFSQSRWTSSAFLFTAFLVLTTEASMFRSRLATSSAALALASCLSMIALASSRAACEPEPSHESERRII
jgi:hypothetical protein